MGVGMGMGMGMERMLEESGMAGRCGGCVEWVKWETEMGTGTGERDFLDWARRVDVLWPKHA